MPKPISHHSGDTKLIAQLQARVKTLEDALRFIDEAELAVDAESLTIVGMFLAIRGIAKQALAAKEPERMPDKCIHGLSMAISCARCMDATPVGDCKCGHAHMEHEPDCVFCDCAAYEFVAKEPKS